MGHCCGNDLRRRVAGIRQAIEAAGATLLYPVSKRKTPGVFTGNVNV